MKRPLVMVDLFAGLGGGSAAMKRRGWEVITVDIEPRFGCSITGDVRTLPTHQLPMYPDLLWASPPCDEFAREFMPWCATGKKPSLSLVKAAIRISKAIRPRFWVLENVKGACRWLEPILGRPVWIKNPIYLWGNVPPIQPKVFFATRKERMSSSAAADRAVIPYALSLAVAEAVEQDLFSDAFQAQGGRT